MHARRIIKIILILLTVFFILLIGIWLLGRSTAKKNGQTPLSFRQFLGLGTKTGSENTIPGEGSATFTGTGNGNGGVNSTSGNGLGNTGETIPSLSSLNAPQVSQFTSNGTSVTNAANATVPNSGTTSTSSGTSSNSTTSAAAAAATPVCGDADTNINFTPQEINELNELQNRFYAIAQNLHADADVETQVANHDAFAAKADQVTELYNYCESKLPLITQNITNGTTDARLALHTSTPFWESSSSNPSFLTFDPTYEAHLAEVHNNSNSFKDVVSGPFGLLDYAYPMGVPVTGSALTDTGVLMPVIEKILRINLW